MANKLKRVEMIILRSVSETITFKVRNPHLGFVTVTDVNLTNDYSYAKVYVTFLGDGDVNEKMKILEESKGFIRKELSSALDIRKIPELRFIYDETAIKAQKIEEILNKIKTDEQK